MKARHLGIDGMGLITPFVHNDNRGTFYRGYCETAFKEANLDFEIKQTNISVNATKHTLRGFHYQELPSTESKVLTCVSGKIFNVTIDLRPSSPTYLSKEIIEIDESGLGSLVIPAGCANAFLTLVDNTIVYYLMGDSFKENTYRGFRYNDPFFKIHWPHAPNIISEKDRSFPNFNVKSLL